MYSICANIKYSYYLEILINNVHPIFKERIAYAESVKTEKIQRKLSAKAVPGIAISEICGKSEFSVLLLSTFLPM